MNSRLEAYSRKLEESLSSHHRFPINLEWLVDLFKYKHISSLTTHLKRHFMEKADYKRIPEGQNKRTWSYHITIDCFSRICHYCRHTERKIVAKHWLKKISVIRRDALASPTSSSCSASEEDEKEEEEDDEEEEEPEEMDEEEDEEEVDETAEEEVDESSSCSTSPENSPRYHHSPLTSSLSPSLNQPTMLNTMTVQIPSSDIHYSLDWSYLKLRSYDITSLYHLHPFHHHHCYIPSHQSYSSSSSQSQVLSPHQAFSFSNSEFFRPASPSSPSSPTREDFPIDSSFDTNAFLSIPDDGDFSPRSGSDSD